MTITGFSDQAAADISVSLEHFNDYYSDSLLLIAQVIGGAKHAIAASVAAVTPQCITFEALCGEASPLLLPLECSNEIQDVAGFQIQLRTRLTEARQAVGSDLPLTKFETEVARIATLDTYITEVVRVEAVNPHIRQITFAGGFATYDSMGADQFLYVMTPKPGVEHVITDTFKMAELQSVPENSRPGGAYYTVRAWRPDVQEIDMWFLLHKHEGPVSGWAKQAKPGDRVAMWGPRRGFTPPADTTSYLLLGDETAFPAIAAVLDEIPVTLPVQVLLETASAEDVFDLTTRTNTNIGWFFRETTAQDANPLLTAVEGLSFDEMRGLYIFGAGEAKRIASVRRYLKKTKGIPPDQMRLVGYWRQH